MKVQMIKQITLATLMILPAFHTAIASEVALDDRAARIRRNLEAGAFSISGGIYSKDTTDVSEELRIRDKSDEEIRAKLDELGVQYYFKLDGTDLDPLNKKPFHIIEDFMGNGKATSKVAGKFQVQVCDLNNEKAELDSRLRNTQAEKDFPLAQTDTESFARFKRKNKDELTGGYLLVNENDSRTSNIKADEGFTVGSWIKLNSDEKGRTGDGYFPILTKAPLNQASPTGKFEWEFKTTGNVVYLLINRGGHTQNMSFNIPWWGDRFGNCYSGGIYRECWHYVAVSFNPKTHKVSAFMMRKFANKIPEPASEKYMPRETSVRENIQRIESSPQTPLRIGGDNSQTMDGTLKGVYFSKKAMSAEEMKAMGLLSAPTREALSCSLRD